MFFHRFSATLGRRPLRALLALFTLVAVGAAQAPPGYYDTVDSTNAASLRSTLHAVIDDHTRFPYTSSATDTWDILEAADEDPGNPSNVLDVYRNASIPKFGGGTGPYNREHLWAKSYGFPNDASTNYPYTDCHHLFLADSGYNSSRSNKPFRYCDAACDEKPTDVNFGQGGGIGVYPGNSNWTTGSFTTGTWEVWNARKGDVARALFYMDVRYEGGTHGVTGASEPDLILTDDEALIAASNTGSNESVGYMGMLSVLIQWHLGDPVDDLERWRNEVVYSHQGNRNPFIDHPEWADCLFAASCGGSSAPAAPTGLAAVAGDGSVSLSWNANGEPDLAGYDVFRSTSASGPWGQLNGALVMTTAYTDMTAVNGTTYWYVVTAVNTASMSSGQSASASATPSGGGGTGSGPPWINEFHYDNASTDTGEFVEVAGPAGLDLSGWTLVGYNGNGGGTYASVPLAGVLPDQGGCVGALAFAFAGLQNGSPDGIALVDDTGAVVEFLSYEGPLTATSGPAVGLTSVDVGVIEGGSTPAGSSLQRGGTGAQASDFVWQSEQAETPGAVNAGQTFAGGCGGGGPTPPAAPTGLVATAGDGVVDLSWNANAEADLDGYRVWRGTVSGGPYGELTSSPTAATSWSDTTVSNGTTYLYVVTAVNLSAQESAASAEVSATPLDTTPPAAPTGLAALAGDGEVALDWDDNGEVDLSGYRVWRSTTSGGPYSQVNGGTLLTSDWLDTGVTNGTTYFWVVTAVDAVGNESAASAQVSATPTAPPSGGTPWINEFHYDDSGRDSNEFVELAGPAGFDLTGWQVLAYNGGNGQVYASATWSGTIPNQSGGFGTAARDIVGLQNGSPDGLALVDPSGTVVQFLSYEGSFTATDGAAAGMGSTDIGVFESGSTPNGWSLQLGGSGTSYDDFAWQGVQAHTKGAVNTGQSF